MRRKWFAILLIVTLMLSNSLSILASDLSESELEDKYIEENDTEKVLITDDESDNNIVKKKTNMISATNEIEEKEGDTDTQNSISSIMATKDEEINKNLFAGGTGTAEDPFQISDAEQFNNIRHNLSADYILVNDIDLSIYSNWNAIGTYENRFCGTFDGDNHSITGLTISNTAIDSNYSEGSAEFASLFGYCGKGAVKAVIKNTKLEDISITITNKDNTINIGVISINGNHTVENCSVNGSIDIRDCYDIYVGGITYIGTGNEIQSCSSNITMQLESTKVDDRNYHGEIICGGISAMGGDITDSYNYGEINAISGNFLRCGGICGNNGGKISRCANYGDINGKTMYRELHTNGMFNCELGGILGSGGYNIVECVNYGNIEGSAPDDWLGCNVGGIAGGGHYMSVCSSISNCYNVGSRMGSSNNHAYRIGMSKRLTECYSLDSTLIDGGIPTENIGLGKENGASLSEEEISKRIEALWQEDKEETTTTEIIQGVIEHSYGSKTADTEVEELLSGYVNDWNSAYTKYTHAVEETLMNSEDVSAPTKEQAIKRRKESMMEADSNSKNKEKYISGIFHDEKIKNAAYEGFSNFLYDTICSEIDISDISAEDINGTKLVNRIFKSVKQASTSKTYKINGVKVSIQTLGIGDVSFGRITCNSSMFHTYTLCSSESQCKKAITNYMKELMGLTNSAIYQVYSSVCKDVLGVSLDKLTEDYLSKNLTKKVSNYTSKFEASGIGNLATNLNSCYNYYQYTKKMMGIIGSKEEPEKILEAMQTFEKFEDSSISNKVVKKAWKELKKAATNLNEAYLSYLSGSDSKMKIWLDRIKPEWMKKDTKVKATFSCPVNVIVLNSLGQQIGYAGEDDVWFDNDIVYIEEKGDAKIIYSSSEEPISFNVSATAYGVLGCSIEDYDEIGLPVGRTNYYDIELYPGKNITVSGIKNATDGKVDYTVTSDGQTINANEYIPSTQNAVVSIGCNVVNGGTVDGTGSYVRGDAAVLTATPSDNSRFVGWMQGEHLLDTARIYEFTAKENTTITALFADISESSDSNGSSGSNNGPGGFQKPTDTNGTPNHNSQTDNNGTNKDNPVFTEISTNNTSTGTTSPQTGDENPLFMLSIIMLITGGIAAGSVLLSMKARKNA